MEILKRANGAVVGVIERSPFVRSGEVTVRVKDKNVAFPDKATTHNMDRDFEVPHLH